MKVSNQRDHSVTQLENQKSSETNKSQSNARNSKVSSSLAPGAAKVKLSEQAQSLQKTKDAIDLNSVNEEKVARLQKLIDEGRYEPDAAKIADKLVDEHLWMPESTDSSS